MFVRDLDFFKQLKKIVQNCFQVKSMMGLVRTASAVSGERGSFLVPKISQAPLHCPPICPLTVHSSVLGSGSQLHLTQNVFRREADVLHGDCFCVKAQA